MRKRYYLGGFICAIFSTYFVENNSTLLAFILALMAITFVVLAEYKTNKY